MLPIARPNWHVGPTPHIYPVETNAPICHAMRGYGQGIRGQEFALVPSLQAQGFRDSSVGVGATQDESAHL